MNGFSFEAMRADGVDTLVVRTGRLTGLGLLYGWDTDSALWLNPAKVTAGQRIRVAWAGGLDSWP